MVDRALVKYLEQTEPLYASKLVELREEVKGWLSYIPQTFPHYPDHTIDHSEQIILQLSHLLFEHNDPQKPTIRLSAVEGYILCAAAYLHDAGMVVSDQEKLSILSSENWKRWLENTPNAQREITAIDEARKDTNADEISRNFAADVRLRRIIADYVRRLHHDRSAEFAVLHQGKLGRFGLDDPELISTISVICRAHGLERRQLDDELRYPVLRQIREENVNVRLLAILFRLGDLLDLRTHRACPLLLSPASPIPAESLPHWDQYTAITQRSVHPSRINLIAQCDNGAQHRVLADWFQWIIDEVAEAPSLLARSNLHQEWKPPHAQRGIDIIVGRSQTATYRPYDWRFEISLNDVLRRLSSDAYADPKVFLRELIQNSLDATRCRIFSSLHGDKIPSNPALLDEKTRHRYPIEVTVNLETLPNGRKAQIVSVRDSGIGMDTNTITKHLLQIGKSYYRTEEFRRGFRFSPNSFFGVGFLSVFAVSEDITVRTQRQCEGAFIEGFEFHLTGPRNYVPIEACQRPEPGTEVTLCLKPDIKFAPGEVTKFVQEYCAGVEIPILVNDHGSRVTVERSTVLPSEVQATDVELAGAKYTLRHCTRQLDEVLLDFYFLAHTESGCPERWNRSFEDYRQYRDSHPHAEEIKFPESQLIISGIGAGRPFGYSPLYDVRFRTFSEIIDVRDGSVTPNLSRDSVKLSGETSTAKIARECFWRDLLNAHIASVSFTDGDNLWRYIQQLAGVFYMNDAYWNSLPYGLAWIEDGKVVQGAVNALLQATAFDVLLHADDLSRTYPKRWPQQRTANALELLSARGKGLVVMFHDVRRNWAAQTFMCVQSTHIPTHLSRISKEWYLLRMNSVTECESRWYYEEQHTYHRVAIIESEIESSPLWNLDMNASFDWTLLNSSSRVGQGITTLGPMSGLSKPVADAVRGLWRKLRFFHAQRQFASNELEQFLHGWNLIPELLPSLYFQYSDFVRKSKRSNPRQKKSRSTQSKKPRKLS